MHGRSLIRVEGRDTDLGSYPRMRNDDCIALSVVWRQESNNNYRPWAKLRVNLNGSIQDDRPSDLMEAKVARTDRGWLVEMALDVKGKVPYTDVGLAKDKVKSRPTHLAIARYCGAKEGTGKRAKAVRGLVSTIMPVARVGGNVDKCMYFIYGPRIVYENP